MTGPLRPDARAAPPEPTPIAAVAGAGCTTLLLIPFMGIASAILVTWDQSVAGAPLLLLVTLPVAALWSILLTWCVGLPLALALAHALARVRFWPVHALAFFALGAVIALAFAGFDQLWGALAWSNGRTPAFHATMWPRAAFLAGISGACVVIGWATGWGVGVRRRRSGLDVAVQ